MHSELPELDFDSAPLWIDLVADDELTRVQRQQLLTFLEQVDDVSLWRSLSIALLDQNTLNSELRVATAELAANGLPELVALKASQNGTPSRVIVSDRLPGTSQPIELPRHEINSGGRRFYPTLFMATTVALLLLGFTLGNLWDRDLGDQTIASLRQQQSIQTTQVQWLAAQLENERQTSRTLASIFPDQSALIEIENSPTHAIYLTDSDIPESVVECFVEAGHEVEVRSYEPEFTTELMQSLDKPVLQIEVTKRLPLLALQGE